jgi:polyphosphate kinase 2 (PPK2 family)
LVERVEGYATTDEWQRAYDEINGFEKLLVAAAARPFGDLRPQR